VNGIHQCGKHCGILVSVSFILGSLALSRALGDFAFKKNATKPPADQIVSGEIEHVCEEWL
jgi:hypothetical protein